MRSSAQNSEAKGAVCGHLLRSYRPVRTLAIRVGGPNAGHTIWSYTDGVPDVEWKLRHVPIAAVVDDSAQLALAAGSEVNFDVLHEEMSALDRAGLLAGRKIHVDPAATVLTAAHIEAETSDGLTARQGSTGKGIGAARAERIWRRAFTVGQLAEAGDTIHPVWRYIQLTDVAKVARMALTHTDDTLVQVEGVQGYGLGLHTEYYPFTTSSDCRAIDFLSMVGISPWDSLLAEIEVEVWLVARVFPIRVAGNSGPLLKETTWEELGLPIEHTTVTKKVRRVGQWDGGLVKAAIAANGGRSCLLALTMLDQLSPADVGATSWLALTEWAQEWLADRQAELAMPVTLVTTGPHTAVFPGPFDPS